MKPMLAHKFNDHRKKVRFPCIAQPKLNGVRALYYDGKFHSRDEHVWRDSILLHIRYAIERIPSHYVLDGELYVHGWSLQKINGAASVNRTEPRNDTFKIQYWIFDVVDRDDPDCPMIDRLGKFYSEALSLFTEKSPAKLVPTFLCSTQSELDQKFKAFTNEGYEGLMYRDIEAPYGLSEHCRNKENRWPTLLKRKDWLDDWFTVVDIKEGNGKYQGQVGALVCELSNGARFDVGGGYSDLQRLNFMQNPPAEIHVKYEMLSDGGIPLKPTFLE